MISEIKQLIKRRGKKGETKQTGQLKKKKGDEKED